MLFGNLSWFWLWDVLTWKQYTPASWTKAKQINNPHRRQAPDRSCFAAAFAFPPLRSLWLIFWRNLTLHICEKFHFYFHWTKWSFCQFRKRPDFMTFKTQNTKASSKFLWCFNPNNAGLHFSFIFTFNFHVLSIFCVFLYLMCLMCACQDRQGKFLIIILSQIQCWLIFHTVMFLYL